MFKLLAELDANGYAVIVAAVGVVIVQVYGMYLSNERAKDLKKDVAEVKHLTNSLSDKRADAATEAGITTGKLQERDRADLESKNIAVGAAAGIPTRELPIGTVVQTPTPVEIVNSPSDPVPVVDAKKKV